MAIPPESIHIPGWLFKWDFLQLEAAVTSSSPLPPFAALPVHPTVLVGRALKSPPPRHTPAPSCIEVSKQPHLSPKWLQVMPEDWATEYEGSPEHADHEPPSIAFSLSLQSPKREGQWWCLHPLPVPLTPRPSSAAPSEHPASSRLRAPQGPPTFHSWLLGHEQNASSHSVLV